jgi:hypothetical protein
MSKTIDDLIAELPQALEPEFVMNALDEPVRLAIDKIALNRNGRAIGTIEGEVSLRWLPTLKIVCVGDCDAAFNQLIDDEPVELHVPSLELTTTALLSSLTMGERHEVRALLTGIDSTHVEPANSFRFYLTNFPDYLGDPIRTGSGPLPGFSRDRLTMTTDNLVCLLDKISYGKEFHKANDRPGYLITNVGQVTSRRSVFTVDEMNELLDALYWLFAFIRGARTGPILPSTRSPFSKSWISVAPWTINEPRDVETWLPDRSVVHLDALLSGFSRQMEGSCLE